MQSELRRTPSNRAATNLALARHTAFASMFCAIVAIVVALALDMTFIVPLIEGQRVYNPLRDFLSYQVDEQGSGPLMTGVFLMLTTAAWGYAAAAYLAPSRHTARTTLVATFLFGCGLFLAACFRAVPTAELAVNRWLKNVAWLHSAAVGAGFVPAMVAAFLDQRKIVFRREPGFLLTKVSFWMIASGTLGLLLSFLFARGLLGLMQRVYVIGVVLWLATEAHQLFWSSAETAHLSPTPLDD